MTILEQSAPIAPEPPIVTRTERVVRADDQLRLVIELLNLDVDLRTNTLVRVDPRQPFSGVRITFGSQHTVEDTISTTNATPADGVDHRTARDSRLVFELPEGTPYALSALLDLAARALRLDDRAVPGRKVGDLDVEPAADVTALEVVDSLVFSPDPDGRFTTPAAPVARDGVTELWRARLEAGASEVPSIPRLYAIWSRPGDPDPPFTRPLPSDQRQLLVTATVTDEPLSVDRLWLTSQGSFLDVSGEWSGDLAGDLARYLHKTTAGRDLHVEVVERGYLAPFGIPATITTVTERQFRPDTAGELSAILVQDEYLAVSAQPVSFPAPHMPNEGHATPFLQVVATASGSGPVGREAISLADGTAIDLDNAWVVTRGGTDVLISYSGADRTGHSGITFAMPAIFVIDGHAYTVQDEVNGVTTPLGNLAAYFAEAPTERVEPDLGGQLVGWADPHPRGRAGSDRATLSLRISLDRPVLADGTTPSAVRAELEAAGRPAFYPRIEHALVVDETTAALVGGGDAVTVRYADAWLQHGIEDENPGLAFHTLDTAAIAEKAGSGAGLVRPSLNVTTFSQTLGAGTELVAVSSLDGPPRAQWNPEDALGEAAELFGTIALSSIVQVVNVALDGLEGDQGMPRFETLLEEEGIHYLMTWQPKLKSFPEGDDAVFVASDDSRASLRLDQLIPTDGATPAGTEFELELENVALRLPPGVPAIEVDFRRVRYSEPSGGTGQLVTDLNDWEFIGVLEFLEPVREVVVTLLDLGDIEIGPDGVKAGVEIPVPNLTFGVLGVTHLRIGLLLDLPNSDPSTIGFNLSRREDPFRVTFMGFGGTGSLELGLEAEDIKFLYAAIGVTYELAVSLVIVSASLSAALGIDLLYANDEVTIGAYVELTGNASVLGLVNLTGKVLLALRYNLADKLLKGTATVSAEVDSIFGKSETSWSETVEVSLGSDSSSLRALGSAAPEQPDGPSFADRFSPAQWTDYCLAFSSKGGDPLGPPPRAQGHTGARAFSGKAA